jgi:hypothetical protein
MPSGASPYVAIELVLQQDARMAERFLPTRTAQAALEVGGGGGALSRQLELYFIFFTLLFFC